MTAPGLPAAFPAGSVVPVAVADLGPVAAFAWVEFFSATVRNRHTRAADRRAVHRFLAWLDPSGRPATRRLTT